MALTVRALRAACAPVESAVLSEGRVAADALAAARPGGADNPGRDAAAWLRYHGRLHRWHAAGAGSATGSGGTDPRAQRDTLDAVLHAANACEPEAVRCSDGAVRYVYPKSAHALRWLDSLDAQLLADAVQAAPALAALREARATPADFRVLALRPLAESFAARLWAWVLTHAEPGLPFADDAADVQLPEDLARLAPQDFLALRAAHERVNAERLGIMAAAFPADPAAGRSRLSLGGFLGQRSDALGVRPRTLERLWSLGEVYAQAISAATAAREAHDAAKAAADRTP